MWTLYIHTTYIENFSQYVLMKGIYFKYEFSCTGTFDMKRYAFYVFIKRT